MFIPKMIGKLQKKQDRVSTALFNQYIDLLEKNNVYLFKAIVENRNNELQLVIQNVHKL